MEPKSRYVFSIQGHLLLLVVAVLLPGLVFAGILVTRIAAAERARLESDAGDKARELVVAIDRELNGLQSAMTALAAAPSLRDGDLQTFLNLAGEVARAVGGNITLRDAESRQLVNTSVAPGTPPPDATSLAAVDGEARRSGRTVVSDYFTSIVGNRPSFALVMPIRNDGATAYFLSLRMPVGRIGDVVHAAKVGPGGIATIVDRNKIVLARSEHEEAYVGKPAHAAIRQAAGEVGVVGDTLVDGVRMAMFYRRSMASGWLVSVKVPHTVLNAPLYGSLWGLAWVGVGLTAPSLLIAFLLGRRLAAPVQTLARQAAGLAAGAPVVPPPTSVREVRDVADALARSARELAERTRERDAAAAALQDANRDLEAQVAKRTGELVAEMQRREEAEERLRHVLKVEAVGQLTGGIAHDFNNMLAIVLGSLQLLERRLNRGETNVQRFIDSAREGAERATNLTRRLLAFSRQQTLSPEAIDANKLLSVIADMLRRTITETIRMETVLAGGLWRIHVDPNQLENAVLNLVLNARDAMLDGGKLTIETANAYLDAAYAAAHSDVVEGQYVLIAVSDSGGGMPAEVVARAFDPFFTTKPPGMGTGMGLSQVYGFIKQSGGHVKIYSEVGTGTTVKLYLPRFFGSLGRQPERGGVEVAPPAVAHERVLVVEDEDEVRELSVSMLRELGYGVLEAEDATQALALLDQNPDIALLFTDVIMPDMNGRQLADEAQRRRPSLKVLFTTGYTRNSIVHNGLLEPGVQLIIKPFTIEALGVKLREVLGAPGSA